MKYTRVKGRTARNKRSKSNNKTRKNKGGAVPSPPTPFPTYVPPPPPPPPPPYIVVDEKMIGKVRIINVKNIIFTQDSMSHSFTDRETNIIHWFNVIDKLRTDNKWLKFHAGMLMEKRIPKDFFKLDVLLTEDRKVYSCNNRRLCLLNNLVKIGFNGMIECKVVQKCSHPVVISNNPVVNKGNGDVVKCLKLI